MHKQGSIAACIFVLFFLVLPPASVVAAAGPTLTLSPASGSPPSVSGRLSGSGWLCGSVAPLGAATVSGSGVVGSATINQDGSLTGSFTAKGTAGQTVEVGVTATTACPSIGPPIHLRATATFTFNSLISMPWLTLRATSTSTATELPSATPSPPRAPVLVATIPPSPTATSTMALQPIPTTAEFTLTPTPSATAEPVAKVTSAAQPTATTVVTPTPTATRGATATRQPITTVEPTSTPTLGPTGSPTPPAASSSQGSLLFTGCTPSPDRVKVEFLPLGMQSKDGAERNTASGPAVFVPAVQAPDDSRKLTFQPPSGEAGRMYRVSVDVKDPRCPAGSLSTTTYWLAGAGKDVSMPMLQPGITTLEMSNNADQPPIPIPQVKGAFVRVGSPPQYTTVDPADQQSGWETDLTLYGNDLKDRKQRFRWSTDLTAAASGILQVGWLPFPGRYEENPLSPPGLLASWPVDCTNCEFIADLSSLPSPQPKKAAPVAAKETSWLGKVGDFLAASFRAIGNTFSRVAAMVAALFGHSEPVASQHPPQGVPSATYLPGATTTGSRLLGYRKTNHINAMVFNTFYFRIVPVKDGKTVGAGSNAAVIRWGGDEPPQMNLPDLATPVPTASPYETTIVSYHGVIPPQKSSACYVVTKDVWFSGMTFTTTPGDGPPSIREGQVLCPPEPESKSLLEEIGDWIEGGVNWVSGAYNDLKNTVVSAVGYLIPDAICDNSCVGFVLDATLATMGIPPDIPNFDQLMNDGLDYLAEEAVSQVGLPPEVLNQTGPYAGMALSAAEDKFRQEAQSKVKDGLQKGLLEMQLAVGKSVSWIPSGVPVRPDDYQPPAMTVKVTRKAGVPGGESGCTLDVRDTLTVDKSKLDNPPPGWESSFKEVSDLHPLNSGIPYDFFVNKASEDLRIDYELPVPPLAPGESMTIPMSFEPNVYKDGWQPLGLIDTQDYFLAWNVMHEVGTIHLIASGCGGATLDAPAKASVVGMEVESGSK